MRAGTEGASESWLAEIDGRYRPVWEAFTPDERVALARYFLPHRTSRARTRPLGPTRPRLIKWYCPFAAQTGFPSGHRYCINVYTGCAHGCHYCYAAAYEPAKPGGKRNFQRLLEKDLADLERFDVPPAPVHLSNSTDPFQPIEEALGHTKLALAGLLAHRRRFTSVTILTRNPGLVARPDYVELLQSLGEISSSHPGRHRLEASRHPAAQIEVSLAFRDDRACEFWDPGAPSVRARLEGIRALRKAEIPVVLRIDPLFPLPSEKEAGSPGMADFGLVQAQAKDDLDRLVAFAKEVGVRHVVYSTVKVVQPRFRKMSPIMQSLREFFRALAAPNKLVWRGNSWRLPDRLAKEQVTEPFLDICRSHGVKAKFCMQNLVETV